MLASMSRRKQSSRKAISIEFIIGIQKEFFERHLSLIAGA